MASDEVFTRADDRERFDAALASFPSPVRDGDPLYGEFGRRYYPAVFGDGLRERSFAVVGRDGSMCVVECDVLRGVLGRFGMPLRILRSGAEGTKAEARILGVVITQLKDIAALSGATGILVDGGLARVTLDVLGRVCLAADGRASIESRACVDLSQPTDALRAGVRGSYRSLLNWGQRSLSMSYCNVSQPDRALFALYEALHERVAGRRTRPQASWDVMFEFVESGHGELILASLDDDLVAGLLVFDGTSTAHYASAAYVRERFEHPLAHWPLFDAIVRAKDRGLRWFDVGEIRSGAEVDEKEASIAFFKRGFTDRFEARVKWELPTSR